MTFCAGNHRRRRLADERVVDAISEAFVCGTYFRRRIDIGQPGFKESAGAGIATSLEENHDKIVEQGSKNREALPRVAIGWKPESKNRQHSGLDAAYRQLDAVTTQRSGFGNAPNFRGRSHSISSPALTRAIQKRFGQTRRWKWLCSRCAKNGSRAECTITSAAGFTVTSVDRTGTWPHCEKMLSDQAQLAVAYLDAFQITGIDSRVGAPTSLIMSPAT